MRVLLIEDTEDLAEAISTWLRRAGFEVTEAATAGAGLEQLARNQPDLLLLDINLPDRSGVTLLSDLRRSGSRLPVVVITARSDIDDKVTLLEMGADDYLVKPFDLRELEARIRAVLRRPELSRPQMPRCGRLSFDAQSRAALVDGKELPLLRRELQLLEILLHKQGRLMRRDQLLQALFEWEDVAPNALEVQISRLRRKIAGAGVEIVTCRGEGYRLQEAART